MKMTVNMMMFFNVIQTIFRDAACCNKRLIRYRTPYQASDVVLHSICLVLVGSWNGLWRD